MGLNNLRYSSGKRIVNFQSSLHLLNRSDGTFYDPPDEYDREPFRHPGVDLLPRLTEENRLRITSKLRIATFAQNCGLADVLRWKPRKVSCPFLQVQVHSRGIDIGLGRESVRLRSRPSTCTGFVRDCWRCRVTARRRGCCENREG